ncbi:YncE family protein, partial [Elusimicrobiota bacterium]
GMIYATSFGSTVDVYEIDPQKFEITRTLDLNISNFYSYGSTSLFIDEDSNSLYLQHGLNDRLFEIDIDTFRIKRILKGRVHAMRMIKDNARDVLYISSFFYGKVIALDLKTNKQVWKVHVGGKPYGLAIYGNFLFVNSRAGIVRIDLDELWKRS